MHLNILMFDSALEDLENKLNQDIAWRKKELVNLNNELNAKAENLTQEYSFLVRASIALVYAHWEGSVKAQLIVYVKFLNKLLKEEYLQIDSYDDQLLDLIFYSTIKTLTQNTQEKRLKGILDFKKLYLNKEVIKIKGDDVIQTKSNLSFEVLENLLDKFSIEQLDSIDKAFIEQLLKDRNAIAHGENRFSEIKESDRLKMSETLQKIENLITSLKNNILKKAESFKN